MNPRPPPGGFSGNLRYAAGRGSLGAPVTLRPGPDPETVRNQLAEIEGVSVETICAFPAPLTGPCAPGSRGTASRIFRPAWPRWRTPSAATTILVIWVLFPDFPALAFRSQ
jgi:hypothetical protein